MDEGINTTEKEDFEGGSAAGLQTSAEAIPATEFVKVEKNLASFGFFTPSSKRLRNAKEKSFTITTVSDGQRVELKGTIIPSAKYGLPITADQDKWIALCKILNDIVRREGSVTNPVSFTSAEILRLLHRHRHSGKNYREIEEWLDVLFSTTIFSEGVVYLAQEKRRVKDRFRVFDRAVSFGKEMEDGKIADKNYVWFSDWQLQNINSNHLLPIDLEAYRELKNHIAKALVPLLQVWLYATRREGVFEKRYDELCQILNIQQYPYESWIRRTLGTSLEELKQFGYLADWRIDKTSDNENYKIVFYHGEKFYRDRRARLSRKQTSAAAELPNDNPQANSSSHTRPTKTTGMLSPKPRELFVDPILLSEFTKRGITEKKAYQLLADVKPGQDVVAQLEYYDHMIEHAGFRITNPPGFRIRMFERNLPVPDNFETNAKRTLREERERKEAAARDAQEARQLLEDEYERYCISETDRYIAEHPDIFAAIKAVKLAEEKPFSGMWSAPYENMAITSAKWAIRKHVSLPTFEEFIAQRKQGSAPAANAMPVPAVESQGEQPAPDDLLAADERRELEMNTTAQAQEDPASAPNDMQPHEAATPEPLMIELVSDPPEEEISEPPIGEAA